MSSARFKVLFAGPLVSFQDAGRFGHLRYGVSRSGPMDLFSFNAARAMLGTNGSSSCIEVSLGGATLECLEGEVTLAIAGGSFTSLVNQNASEGWVAQTVREGDKITIRSGAWGSWAYVAFLGELVLSNWLGSTSTHSMSKFGSGALIAGSEFEVADAKTDTARIGAYSCPDIAKPIHEIRVVIGPQDQHFASGAIDVFCQSTYSLSDAFDRMGVRLNGPKLELKDALSIPSEPIIRGSVQVSGDGVPTVLLSDHQTTGGYPKIATLLSCDVDRIAQLRSGSAIRFTSVSSSQAIAAVREHHSVQQERLSELRLPPVSLGERLLNSNLIGGVVSANIDG